MNSENPVETVAMLEPALNEMGGLVPPAVQARKIAVVGEIAFCGAQVAASLIERGMTPRVLCPDARSLSQLKTLMPAGGYEVVGGDGGDQERVSETLAGTYAAAFVSPIAMSGRLYRADTHLDDVKRFVSAADQNALRAIVYHSSVAARLNADSQALRDAARAEELIHGSRCTEYRLSTGPLMGENDGFLATLVERCRSSNPCMGVLGYAGAQFQPLYVGDFAACVARVFDEQERLEPGVYGLTGPDLTTWMELIDRALELASKSKLKFHAPLFVSKIIALVGKRRRLAEEVALAPEHFALDKNDTLKILGARRLTTCGELQKRLFQQN